MKKFLMTVAFVATSVIASAQVYVGGGVSFHSTDDGVESSTEFGIIPEVGYQLNEKWGVGLELGYLSQKDGDVTTVSIAPYARYTFVNWGKVSLFADGQFQFAQIDTEGSYKVNAWSIGVRPGLKVALTDRLSAVTKVGWLGYTSAKGDYDGAEAATDFGFDIDGSNVQFSLYYTL